jgi:nitrite reductase/ring-hydroxylating ferredoxin subunit
MPSKAEYLWLTCPVCEAKFRVTTGPNMADHCGKPFCRAVIDWPDDHWSAYLSTTKARQDAGMEMTEFDLVALEREDARS